MEFTMKRLLIFSITFSSIAFLISASSGQIKETKNSKEKVNSLFSSSNSKNVQTQKDSGLFQKQNKQQNKAGNRNGQKDGNSIKKLDGSGHKQVVRNSYGSELENMKALVLGKVTKEEMEIVIKMEDKNPQNNF